MHGRPKPIPIDLPLRSRKSLAARLIRLTAFSCAAPWQSPVDLRLASVDGGPHGNAGGGGQHANRRALALVWRVAGVESDLQIGQKETLPMARGREPIQTVHAIGLMSGTSMDGVDVAIIETDGQEIVTLGRTGFFPYGEADRALLRRAAGDAALLGDRNARPGCLALADAMITSRHVEAVEAFLLADSIGSATVDLIGFHGHTVSHRPGRRLTVQIGHGVGLAARLGIRVIHDFRAADVAQGGQG